MSSNEATADDLPSEVSTNGGRAGELQPGRGLPRRWCFSRPLFAYLIRGLLVIWTVCFLVLEAVQGIIFTIRATEGFSLDFVIIFPVLLRAFGQALPFTLPMSLLFATGLFVGRLNADREMLALRSFGAGPRQLLAPTILLGVVLVIVSFVLNTEIAPRLRFANRNVGYLILEHLGYLGEGWNLEYRSGARNLWIHHYDGPFLDGIFLSISKEGEGGPLSKEVMERVDASTYPIYLFAEQAFVQRGTGAPAGQAVVTLRGVNVFVDNDFIDHDTPSDFMNLIRFEELRWTPTFSRKPPGVKDLPRRALRLEKRRRFDQLTQAVRSGAEPRVQQYYSEEYACVVTEGHRRIAMSLTALTFPLTAFLIGLVIRSMNRLLPCFIASSIVPSLYFFPELMGNRLAEKGVLPWFTEQFGNLSLLLVSCLLLWRLYKGPR